MITRMLFALLAVALLPAVATAQARSTQRIAGSQLERLAAQKIAALGHTSDLEYKRAYSIADQTVAAGNLHLIVGSPMRTPSYVNVPIGIDVAGNIVRTVYVGYRIERYVATAVATHDLAPGTVITQADVTVGRTLYAGQSVNGVRVVIGRKTYSAIAKGQPIATLATMADDVVKAGSTIIFVLRGDGVTVVSDGVARTSGALGDMVSVYNTTTRKTLSGTVVAPNRVELDISDTGGTNP